MNWVQKSVAYIESDCGRFRINRVLERGEPVYQSAQVIPRPSVIVLGRTLDLKEAKAACEEAAK